MQSKETYKSFLHSSEHRYSFIVSMVNDYASKIVKEVLDELKGRKKDFTDLFIVKVDKNIDIKSKKKEIQKAWEIFNNLNENSKIEVGESEDSYSTFSIILPDFGFLGNLKPFFTKNLHFLLKINILPRIYEKTGILYQ